MTAIAVNPLVLKDVVLTLATTDSSPVTGDYQKHISAVTFTPKASSISWKGLSPDAVFTDVSTAEWTADLTFIQDWETVNSLSQFLFENEGVKVSATFKPRSGSGPSFTATLTVTPGAIGGKIDAYSETSVSLGSTKPVLVPAA